MSREVELKIKMTIHCKKLCPTGEEWKKKFGIDPIFCCLDCLLDDHMDGYRDGHKRGKIDIEKT